MNNHITLCKPGRNPVCVLNGVDLSTINYTQKFNDLDEITFIVDKYIENSNGEKSLSAGYEKIHAFMEIYVDGIGYFQIKEPDISNEINKEAKTVTAVSIATELLQKDLVGFTVNTSTTASLEMLADNNINSLGYPNEYITFYNPSNKQLSLLDLVLEKAVGWSVGTIDDFLKNQRYSFDNINENIFSFLTKTLSSTARCIFTFDTINKTVSACSENHIGNDTGIVIAERNLLNSVNVQCDSDNIYTRINVQGKDFLNFADINYGDTHIFNLDYYSNLSYMNQDLIDALKTWQKARDDNRDSYISDVTTYQGYLEQISEIDNKVPTNGVLNNWDNMSMDELNKNLTYYNSLIKEFQIIAQNTHPKTGETEYTGNLDDYSPSRLKADGTVDHDAYMNDLDGQGKETYREIITYVIPNIEIAIKNFDLTKDEKKDYFEDYLTDWSLYGLVELKAKQSSYEDQISTLKSYQKDWDKLTKEEKASHGDNEITYNQYHNEYKKLDGYIKAIKSKAAELQAQKDNIVDSRDALSKKLATIRNNMSITGGRNINGAFDKWFTDDQLQIVNLLFHDTDYTNENILVTKLNNFSERLDVEKELYKDAENELSELAVPQYTFSCTLDNLLSMYEFAYWHNDFKIGNFITLEVSEDVFTRLRLISISYNPFIKTNDLSVEFSNMVTGGDGRNDFSYIFDKAISASKNSITLSNNNAKDDIELSIEMLNLLSNSSVFQGKFDNLNLKSAVISEAAIVKLTADFAKITELDAKYATIERLNATNATITELNANVANIEKAYIKKVEADEIYAKTADVDNLLAGYVKSDVASIGTLFNKVGLIDRATIVDGHITGYLDAVEINANNITAGTLVADRILLKAPEGSNQKGLLYAINQFGNIESTSVDTIDGNILTDRTITADKLIANSITANELDVDKIFGNEAILNKIVTQQIFSDAVSTNSIVVSANANALKAINQQIGGRNLLYDSTGNLKKGWNANVTITENGGVSGNSLTISRTGYSGNVRYFGISKRHFLTDFNVGTSYTLSAWIKVRSDVELDASGYVMARFRSADDKKLYALSLTMSSQAEKDKWIYYEKTWTINDGDIAKLECVALALDKNGMIEACNIKLEKGTKATDWSPAPEDVDDSITESSIANWCYNNDVSYIDGGKIYAKTITTDQLKVDSLSAINTNLGTVTAGTIQSNNYKENSTGMKLSLSDGSWDSKYFKIDSNGKIDAKEGIIAGWNMISDCLYKEIKQSDGSTSLDHCVYINTKLSYGESTEADGTVTTYQSPKGKIIGINASLGDRNNSNIYSFGATYIGFDGSIYSSSGDGKNSFHLYDGFVDLLQTKELPAQSEYSYMCRCSGNNIRFTRVPTGDKPPKTGYLYVGELGNETAGTLGIKGKAKGLFSDTEDLYVATSGEINLNATAININCSLNGNANTATKLETARTISLTGSVTGSGIFDGSGNLSISTTTNHTHPYLPLSGGSVTGDISRKSDSNVDGYYKTERTDLTFTDSNGNPQHEDIRFGISAAGNRGVWDRRSGSWLTYFVTGSNTPITKGAFTTQEGRITGTAGEVKKKIPFTTGRNYMYVYTSRIPRLFNKVKLSNNTSGNLITNDHFVFGYEIVNTSTEKYVNLKVSYSGTGTPTNPFWDYIVFFCTL